MSGGFQQQVYNQPAVAVEGDFASANPWFSYDAGPGGLVAGAAGVTIGRFAWVAPPLDPDNAPQLANSNGFGPVAGFVARHQQGLQTNFLAYAGMSILPGTMVTLMTGGDFWVKNAGAAQAFIGNKAFANLLNGSVAFGAAGSNLGGASDSGGVVVSTTLTLVGGVQDNILTVASVSAGTVYPGSFLNSNAAGYVQPYGTGGTTGTGGAGTYMLSVPQQNVAAGTTIGGKYGIYTVGTATGTFAVGMVLSGGATLLAGAYLAQLLTGTGGNGSTFVVGGAGTTAETTHALVGSTWVETKWFAMSSALTGFGVKITDHPTG